MSRLRNEPNWRGTQRPDAAISGDTALRRGHVGLDYTARRPPRAPPTRHWRLFGVGLVLLVALSWTVFSHLGPATAPRRASSRQQSGAAHLRSRSAGHAGNIPDHVAVLAPGVAFGAGACVAYGPRHENRGRTVFIDPGHGGPDTGTLGTTNGGVTVREKDLALATALDLLAVLRDEGYRVVLSRTGDTTVARLGPGDTTAGALTVAGEHRDTAARIACANAAGANVLLSLHFNGFADASAGGTETLYDSARPFGAANRRLAELAQAGVIASFHAAGWPVPDRGIVDDTQGGTPALTAEAAAYGHLLELGPAAPGWLAQPSAMPGVLCEPLFLTRPSEADIAASAEGQDAIARGLAHAINTFFSA